MELQHPLRIRAAVAATAASAFAFAALPGAADAAITPTFDGGAKVATLTSDDSGDVITLLVDGNGNISHRIGAGAAAVTSDDWDPVAGGPQQIPNDGSFTITVNGGGGDDAINTSGINTLTTNINGGTGNDTIVGTAQPNIIRGDEGDDSLTGGVGNDTVEGGVGNDLMIWNNGDNNDTNDGGAGRDITQVNGAVNAGDIFTYQPGADPTRTRFDRTNLVPFFIDISGATETLDLNTLGGNDSITGTGAPAILAQLDGGAGQDTLNGGGGPDLLEGGTDTDTLNGGAGDDRVIGNTGGDTSSGGDGTDTLVWNDGDGSDKFDGDGGYDVTEVNGSVTLGDIFTVKPENGRTRFDRTNLVAFNIDISTEALDLNTGAGDDSVTVSDNAPILVDADGGSGNDALIGANGNDQLFGGSGNDAINGGGGWDQLSGSDGDDAIAARDGSPDTVFGGAGTDSAQVDLLDNVLDVENLDKPAAPGPGTPPVVVKANGARVVSSSLKAKKRKVTFRVTCPAGGADCNGTLDVTTAKALKIGRAKVIVSLGRKSFRIKSGSSANVTITLSKAVPLPKSLKVRAVARTNAGDAKIETSKTVTVKTR
jgi:Ca2+-binding RTX toxin-like protein